MQKKIPSGTITAPVPGHGEIRIGTLQSIMRQSGVAKTINRARNSKLSSRAMVSLYQA